VWDVATGKPLGEPLQHKESVRAVSFSPDGTKLVTGSYDNTARLWDVGGRIDEPVAHVLLWVEVLTGTTMDENGIIRPIWPGQLAKKHEELERLGGPPKEWKRILDARRRILERQRLNNRAPSSDSAAPTEDPATAKR
jgi:hypothetical protein